MFTRYSFSDVLLGRQNEIRTVFIVGGTGQQGRGAIESLLRTTGHSKWHIKTMTRDLNSASAKELSVLGVEVIEGDTNDKDQFLNAIRGSWAVFGQTFSDFEGGTELQKGKLMADAIKQAEVRHYVFSGGEYTGIQFLDVKYEIEQYTRSLDIPSTVYLHTVFFYENFFTKRGTKRVQLTEDGTLIFSTPLPENLSIPMISAYDIGRIASETILHPEKFTNGQSVPIAGDLVSPVQFVDAFIKVTNISSTYKVTPLHSFELQTFPGAKQIADMYRWYIENGHHRDPQVTRDLYPQVQSLQQWMTSYGAKSIKSMIELP